MKKFMTKIHLWLSLPFGVVITILCLTGAALVFEGEITRALHPQIYRAQPPAADAQPLLPSQLAARIGEQLPDSLHLTSLRLSGRRDETCMAVFRETGRTQLSADPYTGHVNGWAESPAFFRTMRKLHRWLLDPPATKGGKSAGKIVVGISTLLLVVILLSGLILWIPRSRQALRNRLKISFANGRRFWHDCHVSLGFYATLFLLVMALTGLTWSFDWYRTAAYALFGGSGEPLSVQERPSQRTDSSDRRNRRNDSDRTAGREYGRTRTETDATSFDYTVWDEVLTRLAAHYQTSRTIVLTPTEAQVGRPSAARRMDRIAFDPCDGRLGEIVRYEDTPRRQRMQGWFYAVHTGSWGGIWTKILYFIAAFVGATLPLTGYYLWWKRTRAGKTNS